MLTSELIGAGGRIRRDQEAVAACVTEARRDGALAVIVSSIDDVPVGFGHFGVLLRGRLASDGFEVVVKVNAQADERRWLAAVDAAGTGVVPRVFGDGDRLGDLDVGWLCMEWLPYAPPEYGAAEWYPPVLRAAADWHDAARSIELAPPEVVDSEWFRFWLDAGLDYEPSPDLRLLRARFDEDWAWVDETCDRERCHGDVHFSNAGCRSSTLPARLVLFDPMPGLAPWPYDAARCQTLTNFQKIQETGPSLVQQFAEIRRERGLPTPNGRDVDRLSRLFCGWLAVMWRTLFRELQPDRAETVGGYVAAALQT